MSTSTDGEIVVGGGSVEQGVFDERGETERREGGIEQVDDDDRGRGDERASRSGVIGSLPWWVADYAASGLRPTFVPKPARDADAEA